MSHRSPFILAIILGVVSVVGSPSPASDYQDCGVLTLEVEECIIFHPDSDPTKRYQLENLGGFQPNDYVSVRGTLVVCAGACWPSGCILDNFIASCEGEGACCHPTGSCGDPVVGTDCSAGGGLYLGPTTQCLGDGNGDGIDDACPERPIPTLSVWGMMVMTLLMLTAGTLTFRAARRPSPA